jgi:hypothetical protein
VSLDYNLLLGRNWTYSMIVVMSSVFRTLCFPHGGNIVMIDQLSFACSSPDASIGSSIPAIDNSQPTTENIDVRMYSSLMGTFDFMTPSHHVYAMSSRLVSKGRSIPFHTSYFSDPWTLPSSTVSCEGQPHTVIISPTSASHVEYQQQTTASHARGTSLVIARHTAHTSPTSAIHVGDSSPASASHVGHSSPTSASHVGDLLLASASHVRSM